MSKTIIDKNEISSIMKLKERRKAKNYILQTVMPTAILVMMGSICLFPFFWLISSSLKTATEIFSLPPQLFPKVPQWVNYTNAFGAMPFLRYFRNSFILSLVPVVGQLFGSTMTAYSLARVPWKGSKYVFGAIVATMILPGQVTLIPIYVMMAKIHWTGTMLPLTALTFLGYPYFIFMLRQFFKTVPNEISESARIDGAGEVRIYLRIMLPLVMPALAAVGILQFQSAWNDFQMPLIYLSKSTLWPLAVGLYNFQQMHTWNWEMLMAACTIYVIPMLIVFMIGQKQFIKGIATTGFK